MGGPIDIAQMGWQLAIHDHDHDHLVTKVGCIDLPDSDQGDFSCRRAVDSSSLFYIGNTIAFDVLMKQEARASAMVLIQFFLNMPCKALEVLRQFW